MKNYTNSIAIDTSDLKKRNEGHILRKIWHLSGILFLFLLHEILPHKNYMILLTFLGFIFVSIDVLRQKNAKLNKKIIGLFKYVMRVSEVKGFAGTTYLFLGLFFATILFPKFIVSLSMLFLAIADPLASLVGINFGKTKIMKNKSLEGFFAAFLTCSIISFFYYKHKDIIIIDYVVIISIISGFLGAFFELVPIAKLDDNFTVPFFTSASLLGLFYFLGVLY